MHSAFNFVYKPGVHCTESPNIGVCVWHQYVCNIYYTTCDIKAIRVECSEVDDVVVIRFFSLCIDLAMQSWLIDWLTSQCLTSRWWIHKQETIKKVSNLHDIQYINIRVKKCLKMSQVIKPMPLNLKTINIKDPECPAWGVLEKPVLYQQVPLIHVSVNSHRHLGKITLGKVCSLYHIIGYHHQHLPQSHRGTFNFWGVCQRTYV